MIQSYFFIGVVALSIGAISKNLISFHACSCIKGDKEITLK